MPYSFLPPSPPPSLVQNLSPEEITPASSTANADSGSSLAAPIPGEAAPEAIATSASLLGPPLSAAELEPGRKEHLPTFSTSNRSPLLNALASEPSASPPSPSASSSKTAAAPIQLPEAQPSLPPPVHQFFGEVGDAIVDSGLTAAVRLSRSPSSGQVEPDLEIIAQSSPADTPELGEPLELRADRQEYNDQTQVFTAAGNVVLRFRGAELRADQLRASLQDRTATAAGNVILTRGQQVLNGEQLTYNFTQERGSFLQAQGSIFLPAAERDFSPTARPSEVLPLRDQFQDNQPSSVQATGGEIQRLRFQAARIDFGPQGWTAQQIRITNDPFSPPELEVRADRATLRRISRFEDRVRATRPRLVLDQAVSLPILKSEVTLSRREADPAIAELGYDEGDRGGVFIGRNVELISGDRTALTITPQFFVQRAIQEANFNLIDPDLYGIKAEFSSRLGSRTTASGFAALTSIDPTAVSDNLRVEAQLQREIGAQRLALGYAYRDRVFNGSLGEQTIQSRLGIAVSSLSEIPLGETGIDLSYQASAEYITARTDRPELESPASLGRFRATTELERGFVLWRGQPLPSTPTAGLRYTAEPVVPYLELLTGVKGISSNYSNGDSQQTLVGTVGLRGQFGHFSRPYLDYTGFNISYSQIGQLGSSPFLFDRIVDFKTLSAGILQQVYGPIRIGAQTSINLDTGEPFNTVLILDYSRRTYGLTIRYSPTEETGSVSFRINGFNWESSPDSFPEAAAPL